MRGIIAAFTLVCVVIVAAPISSVHARHVETRSDQLELPAPKQGRARPLVVIVADSDGAEATDFTALYSLAAFWTHETFEAPIVDGGDEIQLALRTDAWGTPRPGVALAHA